MGASPFTPGIPVAPQYFGGRQKELQTFGRALASSMSGSPQYLAVVGDAGIGKSSILRKFEEIADARGCLVVRREVDATVRSVPSLLRFMLGALKNEGMAYRSDRNGWKQVRRFFRGYTDDAGVGAEQAAALQDWFYDRMMGVWQGARQGAKGVVFLLDEADQIQEIEGAWKFLRSLFTRLAEQGAWFMVVVSGTLHTHKDIKEIWSPSQRFFTPLTIKPMTRAEVGDAFRLPLAAVSKSASAQAVEKIYQYSAGSPYIVQVMGMFAAEKGGKRIGARTVEEVLPDVIMRLSQTFRDKYEGANGREREILDFMSHSNGVTPKEAGSETGIKGTAMHLRRLLEKGCVIQDDSGRYSLFNPLFARYIDDTAERRGGAQ